MGKIISKEEIKRIILSQKRENNELRIQSILDKLDAISDEQLQLFLQDKKITSVNDIKREVKSMINNQRFEPLNELISYGLTGKTIHMHVVPTDARYYLTREGRKDAELLLVDAMERIRVLCQESPRFKKIKNIHAVSDILKGPISRWYENLRI